MGQKVKLVNAPDAHSLGKSSENTGSQRNAEEEELLGGPERKNMERMWQVFMQKAPDEWIQL